jgi:ABC-type Mn2+/Zn2+ transport system permease subunit
MTDLLTPFHYEYMVKAILVSGLIGGVCAFLSCFITLKGWSLMGDALSHAIVPGVSVAWMLGLPFSVGAFVAGILAALGMGWVKHNSRLREDAVIGVVFTSFFALGLLLLSPTRTSSRCSSSPQVPSSSSASNGGTCCSTALMRATHAASA